MDDMISTSDQERPDLDENAHHSQLCRLCAKSVRDVVYIFSSAGQDLSLPEKINRNLPVKVKITDPLPKQLCVTCLDKINRFDEFAEACVEAEGKLITLMKLMHFRSHSTKKHCVGKMESYFAAEDENQMDCTTSEKSQNIKLEITETKMFEKNESKELLEDELGDKCIKQIKEENLSYCCPLCCGGNLNVQNLAENIVMEESHMLEESTASETEAANTEGSEESSKDSIYENQFDSFTVSKTDDDSNDMDESNSEWWNVENAIENANIIIDTLHPHTFEESNSFDSHEPNPKIFLENCNIVENDNEDEGKYECIICGIHFQNIDECLNHSKEHFESDKYPCSMCGSCFKTDIDLVNHFKDHQIDEVKSKSRGKRLVCPTCHRRFNGERTYLQHSCITIEAKQFRCSKCNKAYGTQERLTFHLKFHNGAKPNFCEKCEKEFDNEGTLYYHIRTVHNGERPFSCTICNKKVYSNSRLVSHMRVHSGERPFTCEFCGRGFYDRETLKGHYVTHMSVKPYQCDYCGTCCGRLSLLKQHIQTHHIDSSMPRRAPSLIHYHCKTCNETFTNSSDVLTHRSIHWGMKTESDSDGRHVCEYCGKSFCVLRVLARHRKQEHPDEKPYVCSVCKERSHTLYEARVHRKVHTDGETKLKIENGTEESAAFVCEACGYLFVDKRTFAKHLKEHRPTLSYTCKVCSKQFADNQRLTVHMRLHTGEKPYSCDVCNKRFTQTSALYTHVLLHTGEKPHQCDLCGKAFRIKADRDNHRRTHTGEKPYKCEFCGKQFRTGQVYYQHRMIHTGERRFPCDICGKAFKRSHTLVVHKRIHTGEKPNVCDICGKGFRQRSDMRKHRSIHGPNNPS